MPGVPVMLHLHGSRCLIVGGGNVAFRRAMSLRRAGCEDITVVAPRIVDDLKLIAQRTQERGAVEDDLRGMRLVVLASDDADLNERLAATAKSLGVLVNRADDADGSDITFMAYAKTGSVTLAVDSGCSLPDAAIAMRDELDAALDPAWPALLAIAGPFRTRIRRDFRDAKERRRRILALTDAAAISEFKLRGPAGYQSLCESLCRPAPVATSP